MANTIQIKRTATATVPNSNTGGGGNVITVGELAYSYSSADGSGNESGTGKLYIGHADGAAGSNSAAIIGGSYFTTLLDHTAGTLTASSAIISNAQNHVDASDPVANNSILIWDSTATKYKPTPLGNVTIDGGNI